MPELTEAQLYNLGCHGQTIGPAELEAAVKMLVKLIDRQSRRIDRLKKQVQSLERRKR